MFYEKTDAFIEDILSKTKQQKIFWQPLFDFISVCPNEEVVALFTDKHHRFYTDDCFYAKKHDSYLFLTHSSNVKRNKNNEEDKYELYGIINLYARPFSIPDYHKPGNKDRIKKICLLAKEQYKYIYSEDALPEPIYLFYRNFMSED